MTKLCKDCKWVERNFLGRANEFSHCFKAIRKEEPSDLVMGRSPKHSYYMALTNRMPGSPCDPDGKLWEAINETVKLHVRG
jgi:hypothetical protein